MFLYGSGEGLGGVRVRVISIYQNKSTTRKGGVFIWRRWFVALSSPQIFSQTFINRKAFYEYINKYNDYTYEGLIEK